MDVKGAIAFFESKSKSVQKTPKKPRISRQESVEDFNAVLAFYEAKSTEINHSFRRRKKGPGLRCSKRTTKKWISAISAVRELQHKSCIKRSL